MKIPRGRPNYKRGQQDPKTVRALSLVEAGMSQRKAAAAAGVSLSTVIRAIQRLRAAEERHHQDAGTT